jgi:hypothetical protein
VSTTLSKVPVIDGIGSDDAWNNAKRLEMFKASKITKVRLGYAYVMYDCASSTWFVKAELEHPLKENFCDKSDCDHFVKMNGGGVLANPFKDGKYYANNMGWELSFPASRAPTLGSNIDIQVHANVFEDNASQTASTERSGSCSWITATCPKPTVMATAATGTTAATAAAVCVSTSPVVGSSSALPSQTFYIPMPEEQAFNEVFLKINQERAKPPVQTLISISISTEKTIVWYDHWEDGYDQDVTKFTSSTTEVWGDGKCKIR